MSVNLNKAALKVKANGRYICIFCGSTEYIQGHHLVPRDDDSIIPLCAFCHHSFHPRLPLGLFTSKEHQPYWNNRSAASIAKEMGVHPRTIYRRAKKLNIPKGYLTPIDEERLKVSLGRKRTMRSKACPHLDRRLYSKEEYHRAKEYLTKLYESANRKLLAKCGYTENEIEQYCILPSVKFRQLPKIRNLLYKEKQEEVKDAS